MDVQRQALKGIAQELARAVPNGAVIGLGSGSTVAVLLEELAPLLVAKSKKVSGVPTSTQIEMVALKNGIPTSPFRGAVDFVFDGADQVDADLNMVKGGGGALLREKVVMSSAKNVAIVASEKKFVARLCENGVRVPVEVVPLARESAKVKISMLGGVPDERLLPKGYPYFTENGNMILDTMFEPIEDPRGLEVKLKSVPGVVESGIFTISPITAFKLLADGSYERLEST
jgi:ribose 5-phosphate isomerase A